MFTRDPRFPTLREVAMLAIGGLAGLLVWELFANPITSWIVGGPLQPPALIISLFQNLFGFKMSWPAAATLHYTTGILFYPLGYFFVTRVMASFGTWIDVVLWGVATWVIALGFFATLAGLPFMLGFILLSWMSLVGHVIYAVVAGVIFEHLNRTHNGSAPQHRSAA
jgi:hypothetical protein